MKKKDLYFYFWAFPFIGAFMALIICYLFKSNEVGVAVVLGCVAGYLALLCLVLGEKFCDASEDDHAE